MPLEIERKFLLKNDSWRKLTDAGIRYRQGYLTAIGSPSSVRLRLSGDAAWINIKSVTLGMTRSEFEYSIPYADAQEMLDGLCARPKLSKTRFKISVGKHVWEIDVFEAENVGLILAEIELERENETFLKPDWVGNEVTQDPRYYNVNLVLNPYCLWSHNSILNE